MHSQRLNEKALSPWAIIQTDGKILAAHCDCMAGLGEACTHIAAMLFSIEATVKVRESRTVTEEKAYWLPASMKGVSYAKIEDIDFTSAKMKKRNLDSQFSDTPATQRGIGILKTVEKPSPSDVTEFLRQLSQTGAKSAILSVTNSFQDPFLPTIQEQRFPKLLTELLNQDLLTAQFAEILTYCENLKIEVTPEEASAVEKATRKQSESRIWHRFRSGRITASRMYAACHSSPAAPSESLIRAICNPELVRFTSAATSWGCSHEKEAREVYCRAMSAVHDNFCIEEAGLFIHENFPVFGASPDGIVTCDCCGSGVLEIKCPYCVRFSSLAEYTGTKSCLEETVNGLKLKQTHPYYYQVQSQIFLCDKEYADFVVFTEKEVNIERVAPDEGKWNEISKKAANFHSIAIMPELVGRFYSRKNMPPVLTPKNSNDTTNDSTDAFCICRQGETDTMVACDNQNCPYKWFHLSCLKLTKSQLPKGKWFCPDCSRLPEFVPKRRCSRK